MTHNDVPRQQKKTNGFLSIIAYIFAFARNKFLLAQKTMSDGWFLQGQRPCKRKNISVNVISIGVADTSYKTA